MNANLGEEGSASAGFAEADPLRRNAVKDTTAVLLRQVRSTARKPWSFTLPTTKIIDS
jgi:hypothetical protein